MFVSSLFIFPSQHLSLVCSYLVVYAHDKNHVYSLGLHLNNYKTCKVSSTVNQLTAYQTAEYEHKQMKRFPLALIIVQFREFVVGRLLCLSVHIILKITNPYMWDQ